MPRWRHSSTSYFGGSNSYLTNSSIEVLEKSEIGNTDLKTACRPSSGRPPSGSVDQQELVVGRLLNLDEVRHLCDFLDFPEKLANALATGERLRHRSSSLSRSSDATAGTTLRRPQSIATVRTGVAAAFVLCRSGPMPESPHFVVRRTEPGHPVVSIPGSARAVRAAASGRVTRPSRGCLARSPGLADARPGISLK